MNAKQAVLAAAALLLVPAAQLYGQSGGAAGAAAAAPTKIGILNVRGAVFGTAEGKQALAELQSQFAPRQNELDNLRKQIQDLQNRLQVGERTLSDDEKARIGKQIDRLTRTGQRKQQEFQEDAESAQDEAFNRVAPKMNEILNRYARENGFVLILDVGSQAGVVYASNTIDVTDDMVKLYDQAYPVRAAAPAQAQPATPRPQPSAPKPPTQKPPQQ